MNSITQQYQNFSAQFPECPSFEADAGSPVFFSSSEGAFAFSDDGTQFIDLSNGKGSVTLGHNHPSVNQSIIDFLKESSGCVSGPSPLTVKLMETLLSDHSAEMNKVAFYPNGAEALRAVGSILLNKSEDSVILSSGWHGWDPMWAGAKELLAPNRSGVVDFFFVPELLDSAIKKYGNHCSGVVISPDHEYLSENTFKEIERLTKESGLPLICDDVKHGYRWNVGCSLSKYNVNPDVTIHSKGLSNGRRIAAVVGVDRVMQGMRSFSYTNIFEATPVIATLKTLEFVRRAGFFEQLARGGSRYIDSLRNYFAENKLNVEVRGRGQLFQLVFSSDDFANLFYKLALKNGLIFYPHDNQTPSIAFNGDVVDEAIVRTLKTFNQLCEVSPDIKTDELTTERLFVTALRQIDGAPDFLPVTKRIHFIEKYVFGK